MHFLAILNEEGGTLRDTDLSKLEEEMRAALGKAGHRLDVKAVAGRDIERELKAAVVSKSVDVIIAGGGDGTISAAAGILMGSGKPLAVLPAGTMNLFARSLGIPLVLPDAARAFASAVMRDVDVASANDRAFIHQYSIGLHAKMVVLREGMEFASRLGKIGASMRAALRTVMNPPAMKVRLRFGETEMLVRTSGIGVTNNLFGEGHLPYADTPDGGTLGVYVTLARRRRDLLRFAVNLARGKWKTNDQVEIHQAENLEIEVLSAHDEFRCVIDGELYPLETRTTIRIHPRALTVLVPGDQEEVQAA